MIILDQPSQIKAWVWTSRMFQLALELNTGMRHSGGSILTALYREGFIDSRLRNTRENKRLVLAEMVRLTQEARPDWQVPNSIKQALET